MRNLVFRGNLVQNVDKFPLMNACEGVSIRVQADLDVKQRDCYRIYLLEDKTRDGSNFAPKKVTRPVFVCDNFRI